jgi:hypothetical protein
VLLWYEGQHVAFHVSTSNGFFIQLERALAIIADGLVKIDQYPPPTNPTGKGKCHTANFPPFAAKESGDAIQAWLCRIKKLSEHQWEDLVERSMRY